MRGWGDECCGDESLRDEGMGDKGLAGEEQACLCICLRAIGYQHMGHSN